MTNDQLLHGLMAILGQIVGRAPSPEFFVPVALAAYYARNFLHVLLYSAACALAGTIIFIVFIGHIEYAVADFIVRDIGSVLVVGVVLLMRRAFGRRKVTDNDINMNETNKRLLGRLWSMLWRKPDWLEHEGAWRILQVLRLGAPVAMCVWGALATASQRYPNWDGFTGAMLILWPTLFFGFHYGFRLTKWVMVGFVEAKRS